MRQGVSAKWLSKANQAPLLTKDQFILKYYSKAFWE